MDNKGDFARLLNIIPNDSVMFSADASRLLWDELIDVLKNSIFAVSGLSEAENLSLDQAIDFLTDIKVEADGTEIPVNSTAVTKYYEYKTVYENAMNTYLNEKITVENSTGPEGDNLKQQWAAYREKELLDIKNRAEADWKNLGFKLEVENNQSIKNTLELKKYLDIYRQVYLNEINISEIPDLHGIGIGFCTTFFSPIDAFDTNLPWTKLTLTKEEIASLIQSVSVELKGLFTSMQASDDIESCSLEYNNVVVIRPWYKPEFFASRYWKLSEDMVVSDGNVPRKGKIPAYITSMIVVRNIKITRKKKAGSEPLVLPIISITPIQTLKMSRTPVTIKSRLASEAIPARAEVEIRPKAVSRFSVAEAAPRSFRTMAATTSVRGKPVSFSSFKSSLLISRFKQPVAQPVDSQTTLDIKLNEKKSYVSEKYIGMTIKTPFSPALPTSVEPSGPYANDLITETYNMDGVAVLAFVCKRVPKSPDPDNTLTWNT
ncbi:hypothetical protein [Methanomethylovorans sp. PtaU1.Bin093]|uniref:hypothetical protein n=1 Tax=Methanomethylovorans sp. PtaU1.Bin093 TaxID=1811679 RepID=UPI0025EA7AD8|nr:hypothetical protein [Methanomethylovorans sp. PtaU1.Bin093]